MSARALGRLFLAYATVLALLCVAVRWTVALHPLEDGSVVVVETTWKGGEILRRTVRPLGPRDAAPTSEDTVLEVALAEAPLPAAPHLFEMSIVPGKDGVKAILEGKTAYVTTDDLLRAQAYDRAANFASVSLGLGTDRATVLGLLAPQLGVRAADVEGRAVLRRVRFERRTFAPPPPRVTEASLSRDLVRGAIRDAALYLARGVDARGRFRYMVAAATDQTLVGYNIPRHAGATFFLAQAARVAADPEIAYAALRAASYLRDEATFTCGRAKCLGTNDEINVGSTALAGIAFAEIDASGLDRSYRPLLAEIGAFLRGQMRADGELMHEYDRKGARPVDVQYLYFTGEAALALSRIHAVLHDPADLDAAKRALAHLVGPGWSFFGSRYYWSEEHWTCQALADLWDRAPSEEALAFCLRWHAYQRRIQFAPGESAFDAEGAFGFGNFINPRVTPASSRGEAAGATLAALRRAHPQDPEVGRLETELRRAMAFVLRQQLRPGPRHLFRDPDAVYGALPGSLVDWSLRIDYAQHAGSMLVRWLELEETKAAERSSPR